MHRPLAQWPVCLEARYPAYISWEQYLQNQARLQDNQNRYQAERHGVPRQGQALLAGIVRCGRCGARMHWRYSGPQGQYPVYVCSLARHEYNAPRCQEVRALALDAALEPDRLVLALAALEQLQRETEALQRQWRLRLERARYEAERAHRQYNAVEPEHRLVARSLERQWEEKLCAYEGLEQAHQRWASRQQLVLNEDDRRAILALGEDLPRVWHAPTTTAADRKHLLRLVIQSVVGDAKRGRGRLWYRIDWQTGATSEHWLIRNVQRYAEHPHLEALQGRGWELVANQKMDEEIAAILNAEGLRTARGRLFSGNPIWELRHHWQLPTVKENGNDSNPLRWRDGTYSVQGVAAAMGVTLGTVYQWIGKGLVKGQQRAKGMPWKVSLTEQDISILQGYVSKVRRTKQSKMEAI